MESNQNNLLVKKFGARISVSDFKSYEVVEPDIFQWDITSPQAPVPNRVVNWVAVHLSPKGFEHLVAELERMERLWQMYWDIESKLDSRSWEDRREDKIRESNPSVKLAYERYQTLLNMANRK
jgi:hypothetical protein